MTSPSSTKSEPPSSETRRRCSPPSEAPKRWSGLTVAWPLCWVKKDSREICPLPKTRAGKPTTFETNNNNNIETSTRTSTFPRATYTIEPNRIYSIEKSTPSKNNNKPKRLDWLGHLFSLPFSLCPKSFPTFSNTNNNNRSVDRSDKKSVRHYLRGCIEGWSLHFDALRWDGRCTLLLAVILVIFRTD